MSYGGYGIEIEKYPYRRDIPICEIKSVVHFVAFVDVRFTE